MDENNKVELEINLVLDLYKKRVAELEHENILLQAQIWKLQQEKKNMQQE